MTDAGQALTWLDWWHSGYWREAHPSWHEGNPFFQLPLYQQHKLARSHGAIIGRQWGVSTETPGFPSPLLQNILLLPEQEKMVLLALVQEICFSDTALAEETKAWCQRLARGVRPQNWLPALPQGASTQSATLHLLHELFPECWTRLRMAFPRDSVMTIQQSLSGLPKRRLQPIWEAALWRCQPLEPAVSEQQAQDEEYADEGYTEEGYTEEEYEQEEYTQQSAEENVDPDHYNEGR